MDNQLQRCNIRFSNYISNQGNNVSLRKVIQALIGGERDTVVLSRLVHGRTKNRHGVETITGWAGLRPRNDESAGKIQSRKTLHGNRLTLLQF
jgi:hypothetical protein